MSCLNPLPPAASDPVVVVLPYAGAVLDCASVARVALGTAAAVVGVTYPGHGSSDDEPLTDAEALIGLLVEELMPLAERRLVLLGFSMGGKLAFHLTRRLAERGLRPGGLIACMSRAPHTGIGHRPIARLPLAEFAVEATGLGLLAPGLTALPGSEPLVRALRADLAVVEWLPTFAGPPLTVPAAVVGATGDWLVPDPALRRWADVVTEPLQLRVAGTHLGWLEAPEAVVGAVARAFDHVEALAGESMAS
jgi:surfactin synthase thioesterase subunit